MSGRSELETKYRIKTQNVVNGNPTLKHYVNFINSSEYMTQYTYTCIVAAFLRHVNKPETSLTFDDFNDYLSDIKYINKNETKTSSYMITVYSALKKFCEYLSVSGKINGNYMEHIKRPKSVEKQSTIKKREKAYLTEQEIHKIINNIYIDPSTKRELADEWKARNCAIIYLFLFTGLRCSALSSVDIDDIDFEEKVLFSTDKGSNVRRIEMSDSLCGVLKDWIGFRNKIVNKDNRSLFISNRKTRMSNQAIALMVNTYAKRCGIKDKEITPHKLRATYGTHLQNVTGDINFVRECMGHKSVETTKLYIRGGSSKNSKRAAEIMSSII